MTKKLFLSFGLTVSVLTLIALIITNIIAKDMSILPSVLFVIPGSIALGSGIFFASRLFLQGTNQRFFNKLIMWQVVIYALLSIAAPIVSMTSSVIQWSWIIGIFQIAAQVMFVILCSYLASKKSAKKGLLLLYLIFITVVQIIITVNYSINLSAELSVFSKVLEIISTAFKNLQFIVLGAYVVYEKC